MVDIDRNGGRSETILSDTKGRSVRATLANGGALLGALSRNDVVTPFYEPALQEGSDNVGVEILGNTSLADFSDDVASTYFVGSSRRLLGTDPQAFRSDILMLSIDHTLGIAWQKELGFDDDSFLTQIVTTGSDVLIFGFLRRDGQLQLLTGKVSPSGVLAWLRTLSSNDGDHVPTTARLLSDGGTILLFQLFSTKDKSTVPGLCRFDNDGNAVWCFAYSRAPTGDTMRATDVLVEGDGTFALLSRVDSQEIPGGAAPFVIRVGKDGSVLSSGEIKGINANQDVIFHADGSVLLSAFKTLPNSSPAFAVSSFDAPSLSAVAVESTSVAFTAELVVQPAWTDAGLTSQQVTIEAHLSR